jgi:dTDP-4-amino-4,6-dideoxygalactose transaminase
MKGVSIMIRFQKPYKTHNSYPFIQEVIDSGNVEGDGIYTQRCTDWICETFEVDHVFMMTSCTHALETALQSMDLNVEDEVIVPSFTYPSTANAVILAGGKVVFCEVEDKYLTINPFSLMKAITNKTKAIIVVHYGGISCAMDEIIEIANNFNLIVIEDAAQSFLSKYKHSYTGTMGDFGCFSFHGTKDFVAGEGGALLVNNPKYLTKVENFRQKGTNRSAFLSGKSAYYEWVSKGSSFSPSELTMALLYGQFLLKEEILVKRRSMFNYYEEKLQEILSSHGLEDEIRISSNPSHDVNGHLYFLIFKDAQKAGHFSDYLYQAGIETRTHFVPLHESMMGGQFIREHNDFTIEQKLGKRLIRLPIYPDLHQEEREFIITTIESFFDQREDV